MTRPVLITGVAGFIGSHLAQRMTNSGYPVIGLDNFDTYYPEQIKRKNIQSLEKKSNFKLIEGDIRDTVLLKKLFYQNDFQYVMHLAARAGVRPSLEYPLQYQDINIAGTLTLLQACQNRNIEKFIFASSSSVYGLNAVSPFTEEAKINCPASPYAASKASAELFCRTHNQLFRLPVVILRLFTVYGPRQRPDLAIYRFAKQILQNEEVILFGDGDSKRDYTFVDDVIDGFMAAKNYHGDSFQIFNIGGGHAVNLRYLLQLIEQALGKKARIKFSSPVLGEMPTTLADISKAGTLLDYHPKANIEEGITRFIAWFLAEEGS